MKKDYSTKLIDKSLVDKIYDFESYHVLDLILKKKWRPTITLFTYFLSDPRITVNNTLTLIYIACHGPHVDNV